MKRPLVRAKLDYPFEAPACDGSVVEVAPGILWARMPMPMALDHINVYLLKDTSGWILVDTGLNTQASRQGIVRSQTVFLARRNLSLRLHDIRSMLLDRLQTAVEYLLAANSHNLRSRGLTGQHAQQGIEHLTSRLH